MSGPRIVVLMGAYNEAQYLDETIGAVLAQSMPDFGLLLFDHGSTDATRFIMRRHADQDERVTVIWKDENSTPGRAMNFGIGYAHALWPDCQWFVTAGADDVMQPEYLERILFAAESDPEANLIFSPWQWIGHPEKGIKYFPRFDKETCHAEHQIPAWAAMRRDLWEAAGPHDETMIAADWDWVVRARHLIRAHQLEVPYIRLRVRDGARVTQSEEVHWPTLHRRFCEMVGKPVPDWAQEANATC